MKRSIEQNLTLPMFRVERQITKYIRTAALSLYTMIYKLVGKLLHTSAFFSHPQRDIQQGKTQIWLVISEMCNNTVKTQILKWLKCKKYSAECIY